jgi:hypothetical protein
MHRHDGRGFRYQLGPEFDCGGAPVLHPKQEEFTARYRTAPTSAAVQPVRGEWVETPRGVRLIAWAGLGDERIRLYFSVDVGQRGSRRCRVASVDVFDRPERWPVHAWSAGRRVARLRRAVAAAAGR